MPGLGFFPVIGGTAPYDEAYFAKYAGYASTELGRALTAARIAFVARHYDGPVIDVGIGSGAFLEARAAAGAQCDRGYDVNPAGRAWLAARHWWLDPHAGEVRAVTLWDVLEHIADFRPLLANVREWVFVSVPIVPGDGPVSTAWKHFRPLEHCWYFTEHGLAWIMLKCGFVLVEKHREETELGREDIGSFAFRRRRRP